MPSLGQAQVGSLRSTPKQLNVKAADKFALMFKNYGNNHNAPFIWSAKATVASGNTEVTIADGIKFYNMDLATYGTFVATPTSNPGDNYWVSKDTGNNTVKLVVGSAVVTDVEFEVMVMLGESAAVSTYDTRGTGAPQQSLP